MPRASRALILAVATVAAVVALGGCSMFGHDDNRPVYIFGDSLTAFSRDYLDVVAHDEHQKVVVEAVPGLAMCDAEKEAERVLRDENPKAMLLIFAGNNATPCVHGLQGVALAAAYENTARAIAKVAREEGVPLVLVGPPAMNAPRWKVDAPLINQAYQRVANDMQDVSYVGLGPTLSPNGFAYTLPCLPGETRPKGCIDGKIRVRNADGVHFDEAGADGYSSGSYRFARTVIATAKDAA